MNDKVAYKKFKEIKKVAGTVNYVEWRNWIEEEVADYSQDKITNLLKSYQIRYETLKEEDEPKATSLFIPLSSIFITFMTIGASLMISTINNLISSLNKVGASIQTKEYMEVVEDTLTTGAMGSLNIVSLIGVIIIFLIAFAYYSDYIRQKRKAGEKVYCREMLEVLQKILEEKKEEKNV